MQNFIGKTIDRYRIDAEQGVGGMAVVYKAFDTRLEREVALKLIRTEQIPPIQLERILERFRREAKNLAKLTDVPGVVTVHDFGVFEQKPYLVMSYLPGGTLKDRLGKPLNPKESLEQLLPVAEALAIIHEMGIIHRDIKPSNLLINRFGKLALADFGIAKAFESGDATLTGTGMGVGTPEYMAPEQWRGNTVLQSDIYSFGVVYYEMVTGKKPFEAETATDLFLKIMTEPLIDPKEIVASIPGDVSQFLKRCLARELDQRIPTVINLLEEMKQLLSESSAPKISLEKEPKKPPQKTAQLESQQHEPVQALKPISETETYDFIEESFETVIEQKPGVPIQTECYDPIQTEQYSPIETMKVFLNDRESMTFVKVPAGEFLMGSGENGKASHFDEKPMHRVYLDAYWIAQTPITNRQYQVIDFDHSFPIDKNDHPVVNISWIQAKNFCESLSKILNEFLCLPSEAEWEKAARGVDGRIYPWGNQPPNDQLALFNRSHGNTKPVGSYPKGMSPFGALDMAGNVWEWVEDYYDVNYYRVSPYKNPRGPLAGVKKVLRGGSCDLGDWYLRTSLRYPYYPDRIFNTIGFRCILKK